MTTLHTYAKQLTVFALMGLLAFSVVILSGCSSQNNQDAQRIAELEQEIETLKNQNGASTSQQSGNQAQQSTQQQTANVPTPSESSDAKVKDFASQASALIAEADAAQTPGDYDSRISSYLDFNHRFDLLENEIDFYADQKELEYRNGAIEWNDYRIIDTQLDMIENDLDYAKEELELRFGVDD